MHQNARATLVSLVEAHTRNLLIEALSVSRHCKRARVHESSFSSSSSGTDNNIIINNNNNNNSTGDHQRVVRRRIHAADINMALQLLGSEKLYSTCAQPMEGSSQQKVALVDFLKTDFPGNPPWEVGIQQHWLAVDGVQPQIPQNPSKSLHHHHHATAGSTTSAGPDIGGGVPSEGVSGELLKVLQLQTSLLSEELLLYYSRVTRVLYLFDRPSQQDAVLKRLANDPGLQELVPFLIRFCQEELYDAVANSEWDRGRILVRLAYSLLQNQHLHLELHLHELLPALMTCVVTQQASSQSSTVSSSSSSSWALRREAADILIYACNVFGSEYATLKSRVLKALCQAMDSDKHLTSRYGGIVGLTAFGPKALAAFLIEPALEWFSEFETALNGELGEEDLYNIEMCQRAILDAVGKVLCSDSARSTEMFELQKALGDRWVVFGCCNDEYAECFI